MGNLKNSWRAIFLVLLSDKLSTVLFLYIGGFLYRETKREVISDDGLLTFWATCNLLVGFKS